MLHSVMLGTMQPEALQRAAGPHRHKAAQLATVAKVQLPDTLMKAVEAKGCHSAGELLQARQLGEHGKRARPRLLGLDELKGQQQLHGNLKQVPRQNIAHSGLALGPCQAGGGLVHVCGSLLAGQPPAGPGLRVHVLQQDVAAWVQRLNAVGLSLSILAGTDGGRGGGRVIDWHSTRVRDAPALCHVEQPCVTAQTGLNFVSSVDLGVTPKKQLLATEHATVAHVSWKCNSTSV